MTFAVYFGNRGFFPGELVASAIADFRRVLASNGHAALVMEGAGTRYDAVETPEEGRKYAEGSVICRFYGMIIRDSHECTLERGRKHERDNNYRLDGYEGPAVRENGGWFAGSGEGVLPDAGERGSLSEMEGREEE